MCICFQRYFQPSTFAVKRIFEPFSIVCDSVSPHYPLLGSLNKHDDDGSENVTQKVNLLCLNHNRSISSRSVGQMLINSSVVEFYKTVSTFSKRNCCLIIMSSIKLEFLKFCIVDVQQQRNVFFFPFSVS